MLTVYAVPVSLYCAKLRIVLRNKNLAWREIPPPGGYGSDAYKEVVPSGNLPALVDGDLLLADSEAIAEYLNEKRPDPPMLPADIGGRAKARERSRFHDTRLEPAVRVLFAYLDTAPEDQSFFERQSSAISARLSQLARLLGEGGDDAALLTLGDCGFPITFEWLTALAPVMGLEIAWPDEVLAYRESVSRHGAVAAELESYRPVLAQRLNTGKLGA